MKIGLRIKELRKQAKITQPELAEKIGVHETTIRRWEQGKDKGPSVDIIPKVAEILGTSVAYLMGETDNPVLGVNEVPEQLQFQKSEKPQDISYWGNFLENVQKIAKSGNLGEISSVESFINSAAGLLAMGKAQAVHGAMA